MKQLFLTLVAIGTIGYLSSFQKKDYSTLNNLAQQQYIRDFEAFTQATEQLEETLELYKSKKATVQELQTAFAQTRQRYKRIEFFTDYLDQVFVKQFINGAPLPSVVPNMPEIVVKEPQGLQVIEELLYEEQPNIEALSTLVHELNKDAAQLFQSHKVSQIDERQVFEALRYGIIRITALGITGFDTPATDQAIVETEHSVKAMYELLNSYKKYLPKEVTDEYKTVQSLYKNALAFIQKNRDFDTFDRFTFVRDYMDPLYGALLDLQTQLDIAVFDQYLDLNMPVDLRSKTMFNTSFFNKNRFLRKNRDYENPVLADLGKTLFFDPILSGNNERSCASCHQPNKAFTDGRKKSLAFNMEGEIERNSPTLLNAAFSHRLFYDLRAMNMEGQVEHVISSPIEFKSNLIDVFNRLGKSNEYKTRFREAFPEMKEEHLITQYTLSLAIASYISELSSYNSTFDQAIRGEKSLTDQAIANGFNLFMGKAACATCHFVPNFNGTTPPFYRESEAEVLGVPSKPDTANATLDADLGRYGKIIRESADFTKHAFKTMTVRNVVLTAPYMHNGVYESLEQVLDFYNRGGGAGIGITLDNQTLPESPLNLSEKEQEDIIKFLHALTDTSQVPSAAPTRLPEIQDSVLNNRAIGGKY